MIGNRTSVGLDVHARSVVACGLDGQTGELFERRLTPDHGEVAAWLRSQSFTLPGLQLAFDIAYDTMLTTVARRDRLDAAITTMAGASEFTPVVTRLGCLRGVSTLTSFGLAVEIGDWTRLSGRSIGAYLGLVPTESSSGGSRSQGSITKTGKGGV